MCRIEKRKFGLEREMNLGEKSGTGESDGKSRGGILPKKSEKGEKETRAT